MKNIFKFAFIFILFVMVSGCNETTSYTIIFDSNGGTNVESVIITNEEKLVLPDEPTKDGYIFNGWLLNGVIIDAELVIDKDLTLIADWIREEVKTYKVIFEYNNGTQKLEIDVEENTKVSKPDNPRRTGYDFLGWYLNDKQYDFDTLVFHDTNLVAKWKKKTANTTNGNANNTQNNSSSNSNQNNSTSNENKDNIQNDSTKNDSVDNSQNNSQNNSGVEEKVYIDAIYEYYCLGDYVLDCTKCKYTLEVDAPKKYYCTSGKLSGGSCKVSTKYSLTRNVGAWCSQNGLSGSGNCPSLGCSAVGGIYDAEEYKKNSSSLYWCYKLTETSTTAKTEYYCPDGYTLNGTKCYAYYETDAIYKLTCPSGYTLFGIQCQKN